MHGLNNYEQSFRRYAIQTLNNAIIYFVAFSIVARVVYPEERH